MAAARLLNKRIVRNTYFLLDNIASKLHLEFALNEGICTKSAILNRFEKTRTDSLSSNIAKGLLLEGEHI